MPPGCLTLAREETLPAWGQTPGTPVPDTLTQFFVFFTPKYNRSERAFDRTVQFSAWASAASFLIKHK